MSPLPCHKYDQNEREREREREVYFSDIACYKVYSDGTTYNTQKFTTIFRHQIEHVGYMCMRFIYLFLADSVDSAYKLLEIVLIFLWLHVVLGMLLVFLCPSHVIFHFLGTYVQVWDS